MIDTFSIRYVTERDEPFWYSLDEHVHKSEFPLKIRDKRGYIILDDNKPIGIMRYNLFWDSVPFLTLIYLDESYRKNGFGKQAMRHWEDEMRGLGFKTVMTSTQADEEAQHFYRKLGYKDSGCLILDIQPLEIFLLKTL